MARTGTSGHRQGLGRWGEDRAARHLAAQGMVVLDRNWRGAAGEIDLVLRDGQVLVICEVKTRTSTSHGTPQEAITPVKLQRLRRLAAQWLVAHELAVPEVRIDLVAIVRPATGPTALDHVRGVG